MSSAPRSSRRRATAASGALILRFLGTRGEIELRSERHRHHSVLSIAVARSRILVDLGEGCLDELDRIAPHRIGSADNVVFYAPDLVSLPEQAEALRGVRMYLGDGASVTRSIIRRRDGVRIGHASIREQLDWCAAEGVTRAVFTHCGSQIVRDEEAARRHVVALGRERGVGATIAHDGLRIVLRRERAAHVERGRHALVAYPHPNRRRTAAPVRCRRQIPRPTPRARCSGSRGTRCPGRRSPSPG